MCSIPSRRYVVATSQAPDAVWTTKVVFLGESRSVCVAPPRLSIRTSTSVDVPDKPSIVMVCPASPACPHRAALASERLDGGFDLLAAPHRAVEERNANRRGIPLDALNNL